MRDKMFFWGFNALYMESLKKVRPVAVGTFIGVKRIHLPRLPVLTKLYNSRRYGVGGKNA